MIRFHFWTEGELLDDCRREMRKYGFKSLSGFVRMALLRLLSKEDDRKWTDEDMVTFARKFAYRTPNVSGVLESIDSQLLREFDKYKNKR